MKLYVEPVIALLAVSANAITVKTVCSGIITSAEALTQYGHFSVRIKYWLVPIKMRNGKRVGTRITLNHYHLITGKRLKRGNWKDINGNSTLLDNKEINAQCVREERWWFIPACSVTQNETAWLWFLATRSPIIVVIVIVIVLLLARKNERIGSCCTRGWSNRNIFALITRKPILFSTMCFAPTAQLSVLFLFPQPGMSGSFRTDFRGDEYNPRSYRFLAKECRRRRQ